MATSLGRGRAALLGALPLRKHPPEASLAISPTQHGREGRSGDQHSHRPVTHRKE